MSRRTRSAWVSIFRHHPLVWGAWRFASIGCVILALVIWAIEAFA